LKTPFDLSGKKIAVIGGTGLLGQAVSKCCSLSNATVTVLDIEKNDESKSTNFYEFDVTDIEATAQKLDELEQAIGPIDAWVNCAYPRTQDWALPNYDQPISVDSWRQNIDMQLTASCVWATQIGQRMYQREGGSIVFISSIFGLIAPDDRNYEGLEMGTPSIYSTIKAGLIGHSRVLANRLAPKVRVNSICPGGVSNNQPEKFIERYNAKTPLGRMAESEEIAWPIVFLLSNAASYITGSVVTVDGGMSVR